MRRQFPFIPARKDHIADIDSNFQYNLQLTFYINSIKEITFIIKNV